MATQTLVTSSGDATGTDRSIIDTGDGRSTRLRWLVVSIRDDWTTVFGGL